jgi:hypothetical protein
MRVFTTLAEFAFFDGCGARAELLSERFCSHAVIFYLFIVNSRGQGHGPLYLYLVIGLLVRAFEAKWIFFGIDTRCQPTQLLRILYRLIKRRYYRIRRKNDYSAAIW